MIQIGKVVGDGRADLTIRKPFQQLKNLLTTHTKKAYSESLDNFMIVFCLSGEAKDFNFEGFDRLRINRKKKEIWIDYGVKKGFFQDKNEAYNKDYLINVVRQALEIFFQRLEKEKIDFNRDDLVSDFQMVSEQFLKESG
jgi:hypothetical protein